MDLGGICRLDVAEVSSFLASRGGQGASVVPRDRYLEFWGGDLAVLQPHRIPFPAVH